MNRRTILAAFGVILLVCGIGNPAHADTYTFNFNSLAKGATNSAIQTYMNGILGSGKSVSLSGAKESNGYTGDNYTVGPCVSGVCKSYTLASDDTVPGGSDRFIITLQQTASDTIKMSFTGLTIYSVTFDLEIFPDATCPNANTCATKPDFKFYAGTGSSPSLINTWYGVLPSGTYTHSPISGASNNEKSAQLIVQDWSYSNSNGFNTLWFQDWPATIGIDNLVISTTPPPPNQPGPPPVPEPATIALVGSGLAAVVRRKFKASR